MQKIISLTILILISVNSFSQNCEVAGTVLDKVSHEPIAYANISLLSSNDSLLVAGAITDDSGHFLIDHIKNGYYKLKMSFIGYQTTIIDNVLLQPGKRDIGNTELQVLSENLEEINIKATKPPMTYKVDRKVIDAGSFPGADVAIELLENIPSVQLDLDGNLTYRGDGTFKVYINGHPVDNGTEKLRQIPTSRIEKVEVITNPSAKYDAEGTAGIIQVVLKKSRLEGYAINTSIKMNTLDGYRWMFSIDNKTEKSGWYVNTYIADNVWSKQSLVTEQSINSEDYFCEVYSDVDVKHGEKNANIELGFNFDLSDKDYLDFSGYIDPVKTKQKNIEKGWTTERIVNSTAESTEKYYLNSQYSCDYQYIGGTLTYEHAFNEDHSHLLSAYIDYSGYITDLTERYYIEQAYNDATVREGYIGSEHNETMIEGEINYTLPINELFTMDIGGEINTDHIPKITSVSGSFDELKNITKNEDEPIDQKVDFIQDVFAPFVQLKREGEKFAFQVGARVEFTKRRSDYSYFTDAGNFIEIPDRNSFTDFFPSAHLAYNFSETHQMYLSYSRRIDRPGYWDLVPLEQYQSPYSYSTGNGDVLPSYTDAFEFGYKKSWDKNFVSADLFTRKTDNVRQRYTKTGDHNMLVISPQNVGCSWSTGVEFMGGLNIFSWWNSNLNISLYSYRLNVNYKDLDYSRDQFKTDSRWNNTFLLPKDFTLKWDVKYNSPFKNAQSTRDGYYVSDISLKKEFKDGKWMAIATFNDLFSSEEYDETQRGEGFSIVNHYDMKSYFSIKLAYVFDNQK